ncbi:hypothetical protein QTG54_011115 [Skeletonema marinoi]|uniref:Uncharacterized protein n=1 Tax=Skeletonema marinoi TaxID=267567 RepID=A0AAD9D8S3_9STRA|nr:hypothetical protein QTG54_011115 [Skeletonema marinoi]
MSDLPDISSMKLSELKSELKSYGIDSSTFAEKSEFTSALQNARNTMPRPSTTYREVEQPKPEREEKKSSSSSSRKPSSSSQRTSSSSSSSSRRPAPTPAPTTAAPAPPTTNPINIKKLTAMRSPVTAFQQIKEHPSQNIIGERNNSFLPGSPFSFSLHGSVQESDSAIIRIPDGVCLKMNCASVQRKAMDEYLKQKGSIGVSLRLSSEENPEMLPIWTFARDRSSGYTMSGLGLRVCGPRTLRLLAFMEMGYRSGQSVDVHVFGSVSLNKDAFD